MKLFETLFTRRRLRGAYPEALVQAAIERTVDGTDARLRLLPGYRRRLREPVLHALDHVRDLVASTPAPVVAGRARYHDDPCLSALFACADDMLERLERASAALAVQSLQRDRAATLTALLLVERVEKNILGMELVDGLLQREVAQTAVNFIGHRLLDPTASELKARRQLKRRAFDHLLKLARNQLVDVDAARTKLARQRERLQRQLLSGTNTDGSETDVRRTLQGLERELTALGAGEHVLMANLEQVAELLASAERQLWVEPLTLHLDAMNIRRHPRHPEARQIPLLEWRNARGRRAIPLLLTFKPSELASFSPVATAVRDAVV